MAKQNGCNDDIKDYLRRSLFAHNNEQVQSLKSFGNAERILTDLLQRSVLHGESNSVVVTGPNGSGKSWLVQRVLKSLEDTSKLRNNYIVINLNGLVHTDDRKALLEIARQLNLASQLEEKINLSFSAALSHMLQIIRAGNKHNKCIIFILEEFHLFTNHKNQTLLYNLFDLSQSPVSPVAVVGVTCFLNFLELLEKRVKSRFSHRIIHIFPTSSFEDYMSLFQSLLTIPSTIENSKNWNKHIKELSNDSSVLSTLKQVFNYSADMQTLKQLLGNAVTQLCDNIMSAEVLEESLSMCSFYNDCKVSLIQDLSVTELSLLIASKHVTELTNGDPINFEMIYNEYLNFVSRRSHTKDSISKPILMKAFEKLLSLNFYYPVVGGEGKNTMKEYRQVKLTLESSQLLSGVKNYKCCPTYLSLWVESKPTMS